MADNFQEKTEQATDKRLEEARKKGQVAQSKELPTGAIILCSSLFLCFTLAYGFREILKIYVTYVKNIHVDVNPDNIYELLSFGALHWLKLVIPYFGLLVALVLLSSFMQTGFLWSTEALGLKLENLNPVQGLKKFFSKRSAVEVLKSILKIILLGYVAYTLIMSELPVITSLPAKDVSTITSYLGTTAFMLALKIGLLFLGVVLGDYMFQRWQFKKDMMMTQQELKEELKEREGNPLVKSRIRSLQRELSRRRMIDDVKNADVVVTNPTEYAVALKYAAVEMAAPKVVAKGAGFVAAKIRKVAREHGVPIRENKPLARALFFSVRVGDYIPEKFYVIVAELLASIYRMKNRKAV
jgi:flagellar biosynthesis protein FlhB